jgi:integrase
MAGLVQKPNGYFNVNWRVGNKLFNRSTGTKDEKKALVVQRRVEHALWMLENRQLSIPEGVNVSDFIFDGGELREEARALSAKVTTLEDLFNKYSANLVGGAKEANTLYTEQIHRNHIIKFMGSDRPVESVDRTAIQGYVKARLEQGRKPDTIKKELNTLRLVWRWAAKWGSLSVPQLGWEIKDLSFPREQAKPPFQTFDQIAIKVERNGLTPQQIEELWDALFLRSEEIAELLEYLAKDNATMHAMIACAALTGARRSELMQSRIEDFDFAHRQITIREKKRTRGDSYRMVDMHRRLIPIMNEHFSHNHPGGQFAFCNADRSQVAKHEMNNRFRRAVNKHPKFKRMRGWHVLRHSFISVLCQKGVDQRLISLWVGHQTKAMEERYRHLIPESVDRQIDRLLH